MLDDEAREEQPAPSTRPRGRALGLLLGLLVVFGFLAAQVVALVLARALGIDLSVSGRIGMRETLALAGTQAVGIVIAIIPLATGMVALRRVGLAAPPGSSSAAWLALLPVGLVVLAPSMLYAIATDKPLLASGLDAPLIGAYVLLATLVAVNEELWFRGHLVDQLGGARYPWFTTICSALLFGVPHLGSDSASVLNAGAVTLAVGIPFAVVRLRYSALAPLIAWHATIDIWAFVHEASVTPQGDPSTAEVLGGLSLPLLVALCYLAWMASRAARPGGLELMREAECRPPTR